jgi:hypothetical protein
MHNFIDHLFQRDETNRPLLKGFRDAAGEFVSIKRLMRAVPLHDTQIGAFNFFVSCEAIPAVETLAPPAYAGTIPRLARIDDFVVTRPTLGATHSVGCFNNTQ